MSGGLAIKKSQSLSLLLIFALALVFIQYGWVIGLGTCSCCGSCYSACPNLAKIEQSLWYKEAYEFLYCDDCFYNSGKPLSNHSANGTTGYWMNKGNNSYLAGLYEQAEGSYAEAVKLDPSLIEGWINKGNALFFLGRYKESLDAYNAALMLDPKKVNALQGKNRILSAINRTAEAN